MSFPLFNIFLYSGDDQRRKTVKKKKKNKVCFCICCTYVCVHELGVALRVFSRCLGEKQRGRKRVYGVVTATPDDPGGHL